jgi:hypothetical protein
MITRHKLLFTILIIAGFDSNLVLPPATEFSNLLKLALNIILNPEILWNSSFLACTLLEMADFSLKLFDLSFQGNKSNVDTTFPEKGHDFHSSSRSLLCQRC